MQDKHGVNEVIHRNALYTVNIIFYIRRFVNNYEGARFWQPGFLVSLCGNRRCGYVFKLDQGAVNA